VGLPDEVPEHRLGDLEIGDDAVLDGRIATMFPGVRPIIRFASIPTASTFLVPGCPGEPPPPRARSR